MTGLRESSRIRKFREGAERTYPLLTRRCRFSSNTPTIDHDMIRSMSHSACRQRLEAAQHWRGIKPPSIVTVLGSSTTTTDHPPLVGRTQPVEAERYRDQRTRRTY